MQVEFRECDFFNLWIWLKFETVPSTTEQQYIDEVFASWFFIGKLGGFNAENLQVQDTGLDISYLHYDEEQLSNSMLSVMHNMGEVQYEGLWARCWLDLGTSDAIGLDLLINALGQLDRDVVELAELVIGGVNDDWPVEDDPEAPFAGRD